MTQAHSHKSNWILAAAVAAVPLLAIAAPASAQYQSNNDGRARDANNRVGSGGSNGDARRSGPNVTGNQIVNGNVTGGRAFRGAVPYSGDARGFRGPTVGGASDRFIRDSAGVPERGQTQAQTFSPQPFYGESRAVAPPPGYQQLGSTGGYVPPNPGTSFSNSYDNRYGSGAGLGETFGALNTGEGIGARPGSAVVPGPSDPNNPNRGSALLLSPLAGIRQLTPEDLSEYLAARDNPASRDGLETRDAAANDRARSDPGAIGRMRDELMSGAVAVNPLPNPAAGPNRLTPQPQPGDDGPKIAPGGGPQPIDRLTPPPLEAPADPSVRPTGGASAIESPPLGASADTNQSTRRRLATPAQQSTQYNELQRRMRRYEEALGMTDADANREFNEQKRARDAAAARKGSPGTPVPGSRAAGAPDGGAGTPGAITPGAITPGGATAPGGIAPGTPRPGGGATPPRDGGPKLPAAPGGPATSIPNPNGPKPAAAAEPLQINSLATGVTGAGLTGVLKSAEDFMRQGKFNSAIQQYDLAQQVAPNNPMIRLGRANAHLGASSYRTAEADLRQAFGADQALLMAQYDLRGFMGASRLQILVNDLKEIGRSEPKNPVPSLLLAYISYNTNNEAAAVTYLGEVEQRQGGAADPLVQTMKRLWSANPKTAAASPAAPTTAPSDNK